MIDYLVAMRTHLVSEAMSRFDLFGQGSQWRVFIEAKLKPACFKSLFGLKWAVCNQKVTTQALLQRKKSMFIAGIMQFY